MGETIKTAVIIVGAGPTGLGLACQLIRYGVDFVIFDKGEGITPYSKAIGVQARTLEIYEQIALAQSTIEEGTIAGKVRLVEGGEVQSEIDLSKTGEGLSPYPYLLIIEQNKHEHLLYDFIKEHEQEVSWQTTLETFTQDGDGVKAQIRGSNGPRSAQTIVNSDRVRRQVGLAQGGCRAIKQQPAKSVGCCFISHKSH